MDYFVLDRIEGNFAVLEDPNGKMVNKPVSLLPAEAREGDVLVFREGAYSIDREETLRRKKNAEELIKDVFR